MVSTMTESREFLIFQAFSNNSNGESAVKELKEYDKAHPGKKILQTPAEENALKDTFQYFDEAVRSLSLRGMEVNYNNADFVKELFGELNDRLPVQTRPMGIDAAQSGTLNKLRIGQMIDKHAENITKVGRKELQRQSTKEYGKQVMVEKYQKLGRSPYEGVLSGESTYRPNEKVLFDRIMEENKKRR